MRTASVERKSAAVADHEPTDPELGALVDGELRALPDRELGALPDRELGALPDRELGALLDRELGALVDREVRDRELGDRRVTEPNVAAFVRTLQARDLTIPDDPAADALTDRVAARDRAACILAVS